MVKYYNGLDEVTREIPKNHLWEFKDNEKYAKMNDGDPISNENWNESEQLDFIKKEKSKEVDNKTKELISQGFYYEPKDVTFGLSDEDTSNWNAMILIADNLTFPFNGIKDIEGVDVEISNKTELLNIYNVGLQYKSSIYNSGSTLIKQIKNASTFEGLKLISDDR